MANFKELNDSLDKIIQLILDNKDLCKLLYYNDVSNPLNQPDFDTKEILFKNLFPTVNTPDIETQKTSLLDVYFLNSKPWVKNSGFRQTEIAFEIIVHLDLWKIDEGYRPLMIASKLDEMFNDKLITELSLNNIYFKSFNNQKYSTGYYGYRLVFKLSNDSNVGCNNG